MFSTTQDEAAVVNEVRNIYRAYLGESDAWKQPSFFGINSIVIGGAIWTVLNEARNNVDARVNPVTATGVNLDRIGATPPLNLVRLQPTAAEGFIRGQDLTVTTVTTGTVFETADGYQYTATENVSVVAGRAVIPVIASIVGEDSNSLVDQPMNTSLEGRFYSNGVFGGADLECDDSFRRRIFGEYSATAFFGSPCSYQNVLSGVAGVTRSWTIQDGGVPKILFLMEDLYPNGEPTPMDIQRIEQRFKDDCMTSIFYCANFEGAKSLTIAPELCFENPPDDICELEEALTAWLRETFELGEGVLITQIQSFFDQNFPQYGIKVTCDTPYEGQCDAVYNVAQIIGPC